MSEKQLYVAIAVVVLILAGLFIYGATITAQPTPSNAISTFVLSPTKAIIPTPTPEEEVFSWQTYSNDKYQFSIPYPADWKTQEYTSESDTGGLLVAFSPNSLPCGTCTYLQDGYYSVRVYNAKSDPVFYSQYQERVKNEEKSKDYQPVLIGGTKGFLFENVITLEHQGWIYEITFDDFKGNAKVTDSKIFMKAASGFSFTSLQFVK